MLIERAVCVSACSRGGVWGSMALSIFTRDVFPKSPPPPRPFGFRVTINKNVNVLRNTYTNKYVRARNIDGVDRRVVVDVRV